MLSNDKLYRTLILSYDTQNALSLTGFRQLTNYYNTNNVAAVAHPKECVITLTCANPEVLPEAAKKTARYARMGDSFITAAFPVSSPPPSFAHEDIAEGEFRDPSEKTGRWHYSSPSFIKN